MESLLDAPVVVLLALSIAAALFVIEVALPTAGVAGTLSLVLTVIGVSAIARQDAPWWPLLGPAVAVLLWEVLIARRKRAHLVEVIAAALFAGGGLGFGLLSDSWPTAVAGVLLAGGLSGAFPSLHRAATRLFDRPARVGLEALVGARGRVAAWDGATGTVRLQGSLWNAAAPESLTEGDEVEVVGWSGMTVQVVHPTHRPSEHHT